MVDSALVAMAASEDVYKRQFPDLAGQRVPDPGAAKALVTADLVHHRIKQNLDLGMGEDRVGDAFRACLLYTSSRYTEGYL